MRAYSLSQLNDQDLLCSFSSLGFQERTTVAALLAHIAEIDARRLYLPAACPSMVAYCMRELRLTDSVVTAAS